MPTAPQPLRARKSGWPAAPPRPVPVVEYPDWGVEPMTSVHMKAIVNTVTSLQVRYAQHDDVYVGAELTMYWQEGSERKAVQPDVFVAFGPSRDGERRVWLSWEEGKFADFIVEVASKKTHVRDQTEKVAIYESLGVEEYWQHDPTGEFLRPFLLGHRLNEAGIYEPVPLETKPDGTRYAKSKLLALHLCLDSENRLRLFDPATGEFLRTPQEHDEASTEKDQIIEEQDQIIEEQDQVIEEQNRTIAEERQAREAAEAELKELKRRLADR